MRWRLVIEESAVDLLLRQRGLRLRTLRIALDRLAEQPHMRPDSVLRGATGRPNFQINAPDFQITYWLDVYVREIRVVEIRPI